MRSSVQAYRKEIDSSTQSLNVPFIEQQAIGRDRRSHASPPSFIQKTRQLRVEKWFSSRDADYSVAEVGGVTDCPGKQRRVLLLSLPRCGARIAMQAA